MITVLNQKELTITYDMKRQGEVRNLLSQNDIDYKVKVVNRESSSPMGAGTRGRMGNCGMKTDSLQEYIFYVKKADYERAKRLIE